MDRTSRIGIAICLGLFVVLILYPAPPKKPHPLTDAASISTASPTAASTLTSTAANGTTVPAMSAALAATPSVPIVEQLTLLENDAIRVTFTSLGATIKEVELKQHKEDKTGSVVLNEQARKNIMQLSGWPGADAVHFQVKENPPLSVVYSGDLPNGIKWERTYTLGKDYTLAAQDNFTNTGAADVTLPAYSLSIGRAEPLRVNGQYQPGPYAYPGSGWLATKFHLTTINDFSPGFVPLVGIRTRDERALISSKNIEDAPLKWLGVENQFFTVLLTPGQDRTIPYAEFQCFNQWSADGKITPTGAEPDIEAMAYFPEVKVPAGQTVALNYGLYAGPKDYARLNALGAQQGEVMNYGMFSLLIVPMFTVLQFWYGLFHSYGLAIILLTLVVKAITWPLQSFTNRSGKRMQALAPKLKEVQAKFKDQPEKITAETMSLYREYGVNPFAGCLPALIQMPVFFSLYFMLMNAVELRGQSFLWVHDLTQPDTVFSCALPFVIFGIGHFALNPLPLMVTGLTMVMMRMTPQIGDPQQAKIAQFMPLVFLFIFYNFAAALSLYYVINNCVSIIQIYRNLRKPLPELKRIPRKK